MQNMLTVIFNDLSYVDLQTTLQFYFTLLISVHKVNVINDVSFLTCPTITNTVNHHIEFLTINVTMM